VQFIKVRNQQGYIILSYEGSLRLPQRRSPADKEQKAASQSKIQERTTVRGVYLAWTTRESKCANLGAMDVCLARIPL